MKKKECREENKSDSPYLGTIQVDYIFAAGIFLIVFALLIQYTTDYYTTTKETTSLMALRSKALSLLDIADRSAENWTNESYPNRIGLQSYAYRFYILVNNTQENLINQSHSVADLIDELITFNFSALGYSGIDTNSTVIYDENNSLIDYQISGNITFKTDINADQAKWFTVYFDDDSNFTDRSTAITGNNNLTERIHPIMKLSLLQFREIQRLSSSNYTKMKNSTDIENDFHIRIYDVNKNQTFFDYGDNAPGKGDVIALQRHVIYQNSTADIENGKLIVQVW